MDNFTRIIFPGFDLLTPQVNPQVGQLLTLFEGQHGREERWKLLDVVNQVKAC